jgi:uroporphyrinogen-III decarboxylase
MMNNRERFWKTMHFEPVDRLPFWSDWLGPWQTWQEQGLPIPRQFNAQDFADDKEWFTSFFNTEGMYSVFWGNHRVPVNIGLYPGFPVEIYEETDQYRVFRQSNGVVVRQFKERHGSLVSTQFVDYPLKTRADWERIRDQYLDPHNPGRYPQEAEWQAMKTGWKNRDYVLSIDGGSFYGFLRDWIGFEDLSYMLYEDPGLVQEMMDYLGDFFIEVLRKAVTEVEIDFAMFWEDMCYKSGPLLSPAMFRKFMLPNYQKVTGFLADHGIELSWVDCDGNIEALLPLWIEGGVRGFYPLEVASNMDAAQLRRQYGQQIVMWGNVDKRALASGKDAIDSELARLAPVAALGGFIPLVDHGVPDDVPYANYLYYLEQRKKLFGWSPS